MQVVTIFGDSPSSSPLREGIYMAVTMCPAPGQITVILCVRRAATSQPGRIAANLFVRRPEK